jgi:hypothetical protein
MQKIANNLKNSGQQGFPLYLYEKETDDEEDSEGSLFAKAKSGGKTGTGCNPLTGRPHSTQLSSTAGPAPAGALPWHRG